MARLAQYLKNALQTLPRVKRLAGFFVKAQREQDGRNAALRRQLTPSDGGGTHPAPFILGFSYGVLHLALNLISLATSLKLLIVRRLADGFFGRSDYILGFAFDPVFIHRIAPSLVVSVQFQEMEPDKVPRHRQSVRSESRQGPLQRLSFRLTLPALAGFFGSCGFIQAAETITLNSPEATAGIVEGLITGMGFIGGGAILRLKDSVRNGNSCKPLGHRRHWNGSGSRCIRYRSSAFCGDVHNIESAHPYKHEQPVNSDNNEAMKDGLADQRRFSTDKHWLLVIAVECSRLMKLGVGHVRPFHSAGLVVRDARYVQPHPACQPSATPSKQSDA
jgi:hypothetical protein